LVRASGRTNSPRAPAAIIFGSDPGAGGARSQRRAAPRPSTSGILYGMSASPPQALGIPVQGGRQVLKAYLDATLESPHVEETQVSATKEGKVETLYGRGAGCRHPRARTGPAREEPAA